MNQGFTLIEALVALVVIVLIAGVALETQTTTLKLEQAARDTQTMRFAISQTMSTSHLVPREALLAGRQFTNNAIRVKVSALALPSIAEGNAWVQWEVSSLARPSLQAEVFTRPDKP